MSTDLTPKASDMPSQIYARVLIELEAAKIDAGVVAALRTVLLEDKSPTEVSLKRAIDPEEPTS